jgi:hypothetical protein
MKGHHALLLALLSALTLGDRSALSAPMVSTIKPPTCAKVCAIAQCRTHRQATAVACIHVRLMQVESSGGSAHLEEDGVRTTRSAKQKQPVGKGEEHTRSLVPRPADRVAWAAQGLHNPLTRRNLC